MKILFRVFYFLLFASACNFAQGMYGIASGNGTNVIAAGKNGIIIRSTDGGRNWSSLVISQSQFNSVAASGNKYWAAGNNRAFFYSSNSGLSWLNITISDGFNYNSVYFADSLNGWIAGDSGLILRSTNGGLNWSRQLTGISHMLNSIKFLNSTTGICCGNNGIVLKTTNGGSNWQNISPQSNRKLIDCDIKGNRICVSGEYAVFFTTPLNSISWISVEQNFKTMSDINGIYMQNESSLFTCGGGGFIRKSTDGGITYSYPKNPMLGELYRIHFYDQQTGWAISRKTIAVIRTSDGGSSWHLPEGTTASYVWNRTLQYGYNQCFGDAINTFNSFNKNVIYTLAANKVYRSPDIGETWHQISTIPFAALFSQYLKIHPRDSSKMLALVQYPTRMFYTSNYGVNWIQTSTFISSQIGIPIAEIPGHPDTLYFGTLSTLHKSTNFGLNWVQVSQLPVTDGVCDIEINYNNYEEILISTKHPPRVYKSTNGGVNFTITNSDTSRTGESPAMCTSVYEPETVYHLFYNTNTIDGIYRSTDFGSSWVTASPITMLWGIGYASDDPNMLVAGAWDSMPRPGYITLDNWQSYIETSPLTGQYNSNEAVYVYNKGNVLFQQTTGIYKLNVTYTVPSVGIQTISQEIPEQYKLSQNYPNPFNPATKIRFHIPASAEITQRIVSLKIYDILGKEIAVLVNENLKPGIYEVEWNVQNIPSGVYFYSLITNEFTQTKKMVVVK